MPQAGDEVLARWREVGEWWAGEPPRDVTRWLDARGIPQESITEIPHLPDISTETADRLKRSLRSYEDKVARANGAEVARLVPAARRQPAALLHIQSAYTFGRSSLHASEVPNHPDAKPYSAILMADSFSLAGAHEFAASCRELAIKPLIGATLEMAEGGQIVLVARSKLGYRSLSRLITDCHLQEPRLFPLANWERVAHHAEGLLYLSGGHDGVLNRILLRRDLHAASAFVNHMVELFGREAVFLEIERTLHPWEMSVNHQLLDLARQHEVRAVAGGPIRHAHPSHFRVQDTLVCIDSLCEIDEIIGRKPLRHPDQPQVAPPPLRALNAERCLRSPREFYRQYADLPELITNTARLAELCDAHVLPGRTLLPAYTDNEPELLQTLVEKAARKLPEYKARRAILDAELRQILKREFSGHFLIAWDMCRWARREGILFSGRGSVVDSAVAYCLGLSRVDSFKHGLHFNRFLPADGSKRPDIDIDFEAARREDVRQHLAKTYGDAHVATVAAVGTYRTKGIIREVGKVMGIPPESLDYITKRLHGSVSASTLEEAISSKPELRDSGIPLGRFRWVFRLAEEMKDLPRNLRAHSSGVIISRDPICDTVPVITSGAEGVKIIQWDKGSSKHYFDKFDILCLRGNDVLSNTEKRIQLQLPEFDVEKLDVEDEEAFRAMRSGHLVGVPQSASPAMRQAHMRVQTKCFHDAGIVQAAIRPGVGGAVKINEFIARRRGKAYDSIHPELDEILRATHGIIVFQEQVDKLLTVFAGYSHGEAEEKREAIYKRRKEEYALTVKKEIVDRIMSRGYPHKTAEEVYGLVAQFQGYGFAEGHALAFADISIRSIHCQQNFPTQYFSALLDAQPAGYYGPCTLVNEARSRGVKILPPCVNRSGLKFEVQDFRASDEPAWDIPGGAIRVALTEIKRLSKATRARIAAERESGEFASFFDFITRVHPARDELESLILCGAFDSLHPNRRALLWTIPKAMRFASPREGAAGFDMVIPEPQIPDDVSDFNEAEKAVYEREMLGLDVDRHLMSFERERVKARGVVTAIEAGNLPHGTTARVVGNPIRLRFPPTASGRRVMFFDLEDESGLLNVTCFDDVYRRDGHTVITCKYITIVGEAQHRDGHIAFMARRVYPYRAMLEDETKVHNQPVNVRTADFLMG